MKLALALCAAATMAPAQEYIEAKARLSDDDFYRAVSCAAPVSGACQKETVRWSPADAVDISVGIVKVALDYPPPLRQLAETSLKKAIAEVNASGANFHLTLSDSNIKPDISVYLLPLTQGDRITGTGLYPLDGEVIEAARTQIWWRADRSLINAAIVFAKDVAPDDVASIMLEEVTQSMGLLTDIDGSYYHARSIFSESGNQQTRLGPQDIMALRRHYP